MAVRKILDIATLFERYTIFQSIFLGQSGNLVVKLVFKTSLNEAASNNFEILLTSAEEVFVTYLWWNIMGSVYTVKKCVISIKVDLHRKKTKD